MTFPGTPATNDLSGIFIPSLTKHPAAYDDYVIAVGATRYDETRASYSDYGSSSSRDSGRHFRFDTGSARHSSSASSIHFNWIGYLYVSKINIIITLSLPPIDRPYGKHFHLACLLLFIDKTLFSF